ncbi:DUF4394 domain-containing protein [Streptomyces sp. FIT100]|uniref:DUF4394 domain-containing protein n=1 Tax=Streptomyces sp. FIT100 TaxID=2837956 RepID=UPI0021CA940C|nr:DUF4394 domain-containing protein [Streptomyces sp. FIT100]UUN25341.1 DUF4394 domain-containing protein [Streptomyces sp. FIT100]
MRAAVIALALAASIATAVPATAVTMDDGNDGRGGGKIEVTGLTSDNRLVEFRENRPGKVTSIGAVTGLTGDTDLVGIDYRVQNGLLYGVGDQGGIYTLDPDTAVATMVSQLTVALSGSSFGVDFNPAANRLRIVSDTGQNLRHNIDDLSAPLTTTVDAPLTHVSPAGPANGVTAAAYTNNDGDATTGTTLFVIDTVNNQVAIQSPANAGTLVPTGALGVDAGLEAGFDIYYSAKNGSNRGFAVLQVNGASGFYEINLLTGRATSEGAFPAAAQVVDIAVPLNQNNKS